MSSSAVPSNNLLDLIARWSNENPKKPSPGVNEPVLLVKPEYFEQVRNAGIAIIKALYGRGKTYGFGLNLYHTARIKKDQEVIYINAREVKNKLDSILNTAKDAKMADLKHLVITGDARDIVRLICTPHYISNLANAGDGIYLATTLDPLRACGNISDYVSKDPSDSVRDFLRDITRKASKRLLVVIDEFEQVTATAGGRPDPVYVYNIIETLLKSLRPGILDERPGMFGITLLIQELYYPSDRMKALVTQGAYPAIGRMFSVYDDGSIPVKYSIDAYYEYVKESLNSLSNLKYLDTGIAYNAIRAFNEPNIKKMLSNYLPNMPALIAFNILQQLIVKAISNKAYEEMVDAIKKEFSTIISDYKVYAIYGGKREIAKGYYLANALAGLLEEYYRGEVPPTKVERTGYEGAYIITDNEVKILIARFSDVNDERTYLNEFIRLYGNILKTYCIKRTQSKGHTPSRNCELIVLHPDGVKISQLHSAIMTILKSGVDGIPISLTVRYGKITTDDLFVLITRYNNVAVLAGDRRYVNSPERIQSLINIVFGKRI